jgi:hypothetical protein
MSDTLYIDGLNSSGIGAPGSSDGKLSGGRVAFFQRAGLIRERILSLQSGPWSFGRYQADSASPALNQADGLADDTSPDHLPLRLLLLGLAIGLQAYQEMPSEWLRGTLGLSGAEVLAFLMMGLSLAILCLAVSPRLPGWLTGKIGRALGKIALVGCLILAVLGLRQVGLMVIESFQAPVYFNDGTLLDHNAAYLLLHGQNPYTNSDIVAAIRNYHQPADFTTPLQQGALAHQQSYPTKAQLQALLAQEPVGHPDQVLEFESHVSYPALSFLTLVPLVWAGLPTVLPFYLLCLALLAVIGLRFVRRDLRWWVAILFLADLPVLNSVLAGDLDMFYILLVFLAWLWWERWWVSAILIGLAIASKQNAWFFLPFYVIFIYQRRGVHDVLMRVGLALGLFLAVNLPFILMAAGAWVAGVLAPLRDPMFPEGVGLIALSIGKLFPFLPHTAYTVLEGAGVVGTLIWYVRWGRERPEAALVLAVLPLFLAWRSLPTYFYFCALPAALLLARAPRLTAQETDQARTAMPLFEAKLVQLVLSGEVS